MRTTNKTLDIKNFKVATMDGAQIKYVGKKLAHDALVDLDKAHIWKYASTAKKYLSKMNARHRLNAEGKARNKDIFYLVEEKTFKF